MREVAVTDGDQSGRANQIYFPVNTGGKRLVRVVSLSATGDISAPD